MSLVEELKTSYLKYHTEKEDAFWAAKMNLAGTVEGDYEKKEIALQNFISDASWIPKIREELESENLEDYEKVSLEGWLKFFEANAIESEEARDLVKKIIEMEGDLERKRRDMKLGYDDPKTGEFVPASSVKLALMIITGETEELRKAAWHGLRSIEPFVLENGFIDIVKERNRLGKLLGYEDFYDWKVNINEGFSKVKLFELLDELEENTREACKKAVEDIAARFGENAIQPWNMDNATAGDLTAEMEPYLGFDTSLERWGRSFAALGIKYSGADLVLDLVDRKGKYENGFMHGPEPAFIDNGEWKRARIHFTANAVPGQMGSGNRALQTFFHEGGHAAHFSNIKMPAPCFSQEFAPTSVAFAETQSMFLDSIIGDPDWLTRYAKDKNGKTMPFETIKKSMEHEHLYRANLLRKLMTVPYVEKQIYELPEDQLTPENILAIVRDTEIKMSYQPAAARPILAVPHVLSSDSSAYYHGYVLAMMAVYQTREFFLKRDDRIMDNEKIGPDLARHYWNPGNSRSFLEYVESLTGEPFSAKATVNLVNKSIDEVYKEAEAAIIAEKDLPKFEGKIDLDASIKMIHGDEVIASIESEGSFEAMADKYAAWIKTQEK